MFEKPRAVAIEPLPELAEFSWRNAPDLCDPARGCTDYHRVWSTIRLVDLAAAVPAGRAFFEHGLAELKATERPRILVSGGADTGLLAIAAGAFEGSAAKPRFVFADICETPVAQNRLFGEMAGLDVECIRSDILSLDIEPVDAIMAHNFVGFFEPAKRPAVIETWSRLLVPGGLAMIVNNVAPAPDLPPIPEDHEELAERGRRLRAEAAEHGMPEEDLDAFERAAATYPLKRKRRPALTEADFRRMFADAGLAVEQIVFDAAKKTRGPSTRQSITKSSMRTAFMARKMPAGLSGEE